MEETKDLLKFNFVEREALEGKSVEELQVILGVSESEFKAVEASKTAEELDADEAELMELFKANDARVKSVVYDLTDEDVEYDGVKTKPSQCRTYIVGFLNRIESEFRTSLGIYQAIRFWKTMSDNKVDYAHYDSTLRMLGTLKYKGERDYFEILTVNTYLSSAHSQYLADAAYLGYLSDVHQIIMEAREALENKATQETEPVVEP